MSVGTYTAAYRAAYRTFTAGGSRFSRDRVFNEALDATLAEGWDAAWDAANRAVDEGRAAAYDAAYDAAYVAARDAYAGNEERYVRAAASRGARKAARAVAADAARIAAAGVYYAVEAREGRAAACGAALDAALDAARDAYAGDEKDYFFNTAYDVALYAVDQANADAVACADAYAAYKAAYRAAYNAYDATDGAAAHEAARRVCADAWSVARVVYGLRGALGPSFDPGDVAALAAEDATAEYREQHEPEGAS